MRKNWETWKTCKALAWIGRIRRLGVRGQILFTCGILMAVMILSGAMLGTVSYETIQDYHASMQTVSDIYELSDALNAWDAAMEEYVLSATELVQQNCEAQWQKVGWLLRKFYAGDQESEVLVLANIRSIYWHSQKEMAAMLAAVESEERAACYETLSTWKDGMLFLSDQLLRIQMEEDVALYPQTISRNVNSIFIFIALLLTSFILLAACSIRMLQAIGTPIELLVADAKEIAAGRYDTPAVAIINDDEMGYLSAVFNDMKTQVSANFKNMERIIELRELLQSTELKALQAQINPHFLFNVLSVAEEAALCENANQTVEILENISYMLQYSLKCTKQETTLSEELRMVRAYLFLQEKRFGDRIHLLLSAPEDLPVLPVPGMSLQPVVENAIRHGVEKMERGGMVQVQVRERPQYMEVTVSDNGCGIEPELLEAIRRKENIHSQNSVGGIGLVNVNRRMEMFYKQEDLFEIQSILEHGTTVTLRYPLQKAR